mgnify:CR=1 FL=1
MAPQKKLEPNSAYERYDIDGDGIVTDEELDMDRRLLELEDLRSDMENEDKKQDAQRNMAWFALFGMLLYPALVVFSIWYELARAAEVLGDMAPTYFVSVAAIVAAFYGNEALSARKGDSVKVSQTKRER